MTHADTFATAPSTSRENRDEARAAFVERLFYERTQPFRDVVRARIRELREARNLTGAQLADAMTAADVPMTKSTISLIETGNREVGAEEIFVFARVLDVPLARLVTPRDGDRAVRFGDLGLDRPEMAHFLVHGMPDGVDAMSSDEFARLTREIVRARELADREPAARRHHMRAVARLVHESNRVSGVYARVREKQWRLRTQRQTADR